MNTDPSPQVPQKSNRRQVVSDKIKHYIRSRSMRPGEALPTVRALSEHFGASRDATWRALKQLQEDNWLAAKDNGRYIVAEEVYTEILRSLKVHAVFSGEDYIVFSGFRRLADKLKSGSAYNNLDLEITLTPLATTPPETIWEGSDVVLVDSDSSNALVNSYNIFPAPVIGLDADYSDRYLANIVTDHFTGGRLAAERLIAQDSRRANVILFHGSGNNPRVKPRVDGFMQAWFESGRSQDSLEIIEFAWSSNSFEVALRVHEYLKDKPLEGDVFVADGSLAVNHLEVLGYLGIKIPEQMRLIGYDGSQIGNTTLPPMTTIEQNMEAMAEKAIELITQSVQGQADIPKVTRIPPRLIARVSG